MAPEETTEIKYGKPGTLRAGYLTDPLTMISYDFKAGVPITVPRRLAEELIRKGDGPWRLSTSSKTRAREDKKEGGE